MTTQNTFNQPTILSNGPLQSVPQPSTQNVEQSGNSQLIVAIQTRRDQVLEANNLNSNDDTSPQYQWIKGIYDDVIAFIEAM